MPDDLHLTCPMSGSDCSTVYLRGFGGKKKKGHSKNSEYTDDRGDCATSFKNFLEQLKAAKSKFNRDESPMKTTTLENRALVLATVISTQPSGLKYLREFGMNEIGPITYGKYAHEISYFWMEAKEWADKLNELAEKEGIK